MRIEAEVKSSGTGHEVLVRTDKSQQSVAIPGKPSGQGSSVNGGEFLMLALATCYCNDLYREAKRLGVTIESVHVEAGAEFPGVGLAAMGITYRAKIVSPDPEAAVQQLLRETDAVAEVHNTLRTGVAVELVRE